MATSSITPAVLCIGGFSPDGGAGVLADVKTCAALDCYGLAAVTVNTAKSHSAFIATHAIPTDFLQRQLTELTAAYRIKAVKTGAVYDKDQLAVILKTAVRTGAPLVVDPVGSASLGGKLSQLTPAELLAALEALPEELKTKSVITPNLPEVLVLTGHAERGGSADIPDMQTAFTPARELVAATGFNVLVKGGHSYAANDLLFTAAGETHEYKGERQSGINSHGSGCRYGSAVACSLAKGLSLTASIAAAKAWLAGGFAEPLVLTDGVGQTLGILGP